jgi:hypothetical protein
MASLTTIIGRLSATTTEGVTDALPVPGLNWARFQAIEDQTTDVYVGGSAGLKWEIQGTIIPPEPGRDDIWSSLTPPVFMYEPGVSEPFSVSGLVSIRAKLVGTAEAGPKIRYAFSAWE